MDPMGNGHVGVFFSQFVFFVPTIFINFQLLDPFELEVEVIEAWKLNDGFKAPKTGIC